MTFADHRTVGNKVLTVGSVVLQWRVESQICSALFQVEQSLSVIPSPKQ